MGDRTHVSIKIRQGDFRKNEKFFRSDDVYAEHIDLETDSKIADMTCSEVNYAEWGTLEDFLKQNEIEYDKTWADGSDYEGGTQVARHVTTKDKTEYRIHEIYSTQEHMLETLKDVLNMVEEDHKKAIKEIKRRIKALDPFKVTDLREDNSLRFIKEA